MKKVILTLAILAMATLGAKAQDSVFSYTHQGTTLYYIVDSTGDAAVVAPLYPNLHYNADSTVVETWWSYSKPQGAVVVPDSVPFLGTNHAVTKVGSNAFRRCDSVTAITLPATVATLDRNCFRQCFRLASINIPQGVTLIGYSAFSDCIGLTSVTIPSSVTTIDNSNYVFYF